MFILKYLRLGMGEDVDSLPRFKIHPFFNDKDIVSVCAGGLHNLALTKNGKIYSWGCNDEKALGHSGAAYEICLVEGLDDKKIVQIACGDSISAALTDEGHVYAWGTFRDSRGVLGFDEVTEMQARPKLMEALLKFKVVHIAAGANHLVALTKNDKIYSWGSGERGQVSIVSMMMMMMLMLS
jgi:regulator of chromosome condensation